MPIARLRYDPVMGIFMADCQHMLLIHLCGSRIYKRLKQPGGGFVVLPQIFRMPLDADQERIIWFFHTLNQTAGGMGGGDKTWSQLTDSLVMHTVDFQSILSGYFCQKGTGFYGYMVGWDIVIKRLVVTNGEFLGKLGGNVLVDVAALADV